MEIAQLQTKILEHCLEELGFDIHKNYSGRGMFGKECFGFSTDQNCAELKLVVELANQGECDNNVGILDLLEKMANCGCIDSLGLDTIYYYPSIQWPDKE